MQESQITIDVEKVYKLMDEQGFKNKMALFKKLIDVDHGSFYRLMTHNTKNRTHLHITVRIAQALCVPVEKIIKEIK